MRRYTIAELVRQGYNRNTLQSSISRGQLVSTLWTVRVGSGTISVHYILESDLQDWLNTKRKYERKSK